MKVIDLLNKIANGEEVPKKIKYLIYEYTYNDDGEEYQRIQNGIIYGLGEDRRLDIILCDEVEVIEDKKIEKISDFYEEQINENGSMLEPFNKHELKIINKINEIIDKINEEK